MKIQNPSLYAQNDLDSYWLPFTPNRAFKQRPRLLAQADGLYYRDETGRQILDGISGLWCVNAGHARKPIVAAIQAQAAELDYAPSFHFAHPKIVALASRVAALAPPGLDQVFFCNSGSEAVDTAMKIPRATVSARMSPKAANPMPMRWKASAPKWAARPSPP